MKQVARRFVWQPGATGCQQYQLQLAENAPRRRWQLLLDRRRSSGPHESPRRGLPSRAPGAELREGTAAGYQRRPQLQRQRSSPSRRAGFRQPPDQPAHVRARCAKAVPSLPGYQFGSVTEEELNQDMELDEITLDADGEGVLSPENRWLEARRRSSLFCRPACRESGGRPVTRDLVQPSAGQQPCRVCARLFEGEEVGDNGMAEFEVLLADPEGHKLAVEGLKAPWYASAATTSGAFPNPRAGAITSTRSTSTLARSAT